MHCRPVRQVQINAIDIRIWDFTHDTDNPRLLGSVFRGPRKVSILQTKCAVLVVSTTNTDGMDTLSTELSAGGLATKLELSLFAVVGPLSSRSGALVS